MKKIVYISFFLLIAFGILSCDNNRVYEKNYRIEGSNWARSNQLKFNFDIEDTTELYHLYFNFRHAGDYPYQNLYLFTKLKSPKGLIAVDTAQMLLADSKGRWYGKGIGDIFDYQFKFKEYAKLTETGTYEFTVEHAMRKKILPNITDLGVRVEKANYGE